MTANISTPAVPTEPFLAFVERMARFTTPDLENLSNDAALDEVGAFASMIGEAHDLIRVQRLAAEMNRTAFNLTGGPVELLPEAQRRREQDALIAVLKMCLLALNSAPRFSFNAGQNPLDLKTRDNRASSYDLASRVSFVLEMVGPA